MPALDILTLSGQGGVPDARQIIDASIAAGTATLASASGPFSVADVGKEIVVAGAGPAGAKLATTIDSFVSATEVTLATNADTSVTDNGATWGTDCSTALQGALDALAAANGGTLAIDGQYLLAGAVTKDFNNIASSIRLVGTGSNSALFIAPAATQAAVTFENVLDLVIDGVNFVGTPDERTDALQTLVLTRCWAVLRNCGFYGLAATTGATGAVLLATRTGLILEDNYFAGCTANAALSTSVVTNDEWSGFTSKRNRYIDIGYFNGILHNKLAGVSVSPLAWVRLGTIALTEVQENALTHSVARFEDDRMDEFALRCIVASPGQGIIPHVLVDGVRFNVPMFDNPLGTAIQCVNVEKVEILRSYFGYVQMQRSPVILQNCGNVLIDRARNNEFATGLVAQTVTCLTLKDSPGFDAAEFDFTNVGRFIRIDDGVGGVIPFYAAGAISDSDFDPAPSVGTLGLNTTTGDIYAKTQAVDGWVLHQAAGRALLARSIIAAGGSGVATGATRNVAIPGVDCVNNPVIVSAYGGGENNADDAYRVSHKVVSRTTSGCTVTLINDGTSTQTLNADILVIGEV